MKIHIFPGEHAPGPPTLLYTQWQLYPTNYFVSTVSTVMLKISINCPFMYFRMHQIALEHL